MMQLDKYFSTVGLFFIAILIILTGCTMSDNLTSTSGEGVVDVSTIAVTRNLPSQTPLPAMATQTPVPAPSDTPIVNMTLAATATPTLLPTATGTPVPTPTLTDTQLRQLALELFETNNGCQLPCWWGITPGQTEWQTAYDLIRIFDRIPNRVTVDSNSVFYEPHIPLPIELGGGTGQFYDVQNDIVIRIETQVSIGDTPEGYFAQYALSSFLTTYGQPTEVWLSTYPAAREGGSLPFSVVLFYPEQGIVARYRDNGEEQVNIVKGCPQENPVSYLILLPPGSKKTFEEIVNATSPMSAWRYLRLEESTEMDVAIFYQTFKSSDNTTCLETPAEKWHP